MLPWQYYKAGYIRISLPCSKIRAINSLTLHLRFECYNVDYKYFHFHTNFDTSELESSK